MDGFIIGGLLYFLQQINPIKNLKTYLWIAFFSLMAGLLFVGVSTSNPFTSTIGFTLIAIVYAGLIHSVTINKNVILEKFFSQKWITLTGRSLMVGTFTIGSFYNCLMAGSSHG